MSNTVTKRLWIVNYFLAAAALLVSLYVGYRYTELVDCLNEQSLADQRRTSAIASATDQERKADLALIRGAETVQQQETLRRTAVLARENTDRVRATYPAPPVTPCK